MVGFGLHAQAGLEYLMTYGWALVLIVTVVSVLFFVISSPSSSVSFSSSDQTKILLRASNVSGTSAEIQLQNATGGKIQITAITPTNYSNCTVNGSASSISVGGGSVMKLNCTTPSDGKGSIKIDYTDYAGLSRSVTINASGTISGGSGGTTSQLFEYYNTGDDGSALLYGNNWAAQTFQGSFSPTDTYKITSVKLKLYREGTPGAITVSIRYNGIPSGNPLGADISGCSGTTEGNTLTTDPNNAVWREISFGSNCTVQGYAPAGYAIVARAPSGSSGNVVYWRLKTTGGYLGSAKASVDSGTSWTTLTSDQMFEEWGTPPTSP